MGINEAVVIPDTQMRIVYEDIVSYPIFKRISGLFWIGKWIVAPTFLQVRAGDEVIVTNFFPRAGSETKFEHWKRKYRLVVLAVRESSIRISLFAEKEHANPTDKAKKENEKAVTMKLEGDVLFDFGKAELKTEAERALDKTRTVIEQFHNGKVLIEGHTDSKGSPNVNLELSKRRAEAVKDWLVKKKGIPASIITTHGFGETKPVAPNTYPDESDNPQGRQQNRRVEIMIEKT